MLDKFELADEALDQVCGGVIYCREEDVIRVIQYGDIVIIDGKEYCCYRNDGNQHLEFLKYNRNGERSSVKISRDKRGTEQETLQCVGCDYNFLALNADMI